MASLESQALLEPPLGHLQILNLPYEQITGDRNDRASKSLHPIQPSLVLPT